VPGVRDGGKLEWLMLSGMHDARKSRADYVDRAAIWRRAMKTIVGMFNDVSEAQRTFDDLVGFGLGPKDISVVTSQSPADAEERLALSELDATDVGRISACGPMATVIARENSGLMPTLQNAGVSAALAEHYVNAVRDGETLESVIVEDEYADTVVEIMKRHAARYGGAERQTRARTSSPVPQSAQPERDEIIIEKLRSTVAAIEQLTADRRAFRSHFESLGTEGHFGDMLPAYELGHSLRRKGGERWEDVEGDARTTWEAKRPGTWDTVKEAIQYAWSRMPGA
jgi:hypothetical protein